MGKFILSVLCISILCVGTFVRAAEPAPLPSTEELHKLFDAKEYQPLLQKLSRVLQLKGAVAQPYDRVDLLMLRGEALIQLKQQSAAIEAFDSAAKEATAPQQSTVRKPDEVAMARAMSLLVHQSRLLKYTPRVAPAGQKVEAIPLSDLSQRPAAFKALLTDSQAEFEAKSKTASRGTSLPPIIDVIRQLGDFRSLEMVVTKATKASDEMLSTVSNQAYKLMDREIDRLTPAEEAISKTAHTKQQHVTYELQRAGGSVNGNTIVSGGNSTVTTTSRGLYTADQQNLRQIIATCDQVISASRDFGDVTSGPQVKQFATLSAKATKLGNSALATLNDDYSPQTSTTR